MVIAGGRERRVHLARTDLASTEPAMVIAGGSHMQRAPHPHPVALQRSRRW